MALGTRVPGFESCLCHFQEQVTRLCFLIWKMGMVTIMVKRLSTSRSPACGD